MKSDHNKAVDNIKRDHIKRLLKRDFLETSTKDAHLKDAFIKGLLTSRNNLSLKMRITLTGSQDPKFEIQVQVVVLLNR